MRLIDADELRNNWYDEYIKFMTREEMESMNGIIENAPTINAIPIPKDVTNGDVCEKIFGKDVYCTLIRMMYSSCCKKLKDWWNAPYKAEREIQGC